MPPKQRRRLNMVAHNEEGHGGVDENPDKENQYSTDSRRRAMRASEAATSTSMPLSLDSQSFAASEITPSSRTSHSFSGPLALGSSSTRRFSQYGRPSIDKPASNGFFRSHRGSEELSDIGSATSQVRFIGRSVQQFFLHGRRRSVGGSSATSMSSPFDQRSPEDARDVSVSSISSSRTYKTRSSGYKKRNPIYIKEHNDAVKTFNTTNLRRIATNAMARINAVRRGKRLPAVSAEQLEGLAVKNLAVKRLIDAENSKISSRSAKAAETSRAEEMERMFQRMMQQKEADAQSVLPLPPAKSLELQRLQKEQRARLKKLRGVLSRPALPKELEEEAEDEVKQALRKRGVVAAITGAEVNDHDLQKLRPGQWLNDEIINFYGNLMLQRANDADTKRQAALKAASDTANTNSDDSKIKKAERPYDPSLDAYWRIHFFSSFFWENLKNRGYDGVKRWTRKIDIFSKDLILFPINLGNAHWVCGAINFRNRRFEYYDSMGHRNARAYELMRTYVTSEARDKLKKEIDLRSWRDVFSSETPQQENGYDCGVFATQTLEQISRRDPQTPIPASPPTITWKSDNLDEKAEQLTLDKADDLADDEDDDDLDKYDWNFSQLDMPFLRRRMIYEIQRKKLLDL